MTAILLMSALGALTLSSIIAFAAAEPQTGALVPVKNKISAAEREQARAAMREYVER
ncbi:MAG: hypothetical protein JSS55_05605 [Proteobacteria bacterium]|nr:hypothetical protein [Pseudomonadota bacterium]